jgi:GTP cyclohydrolase IA
MESGFPIKPVTSPSGATFGGVDNREALKKVTAEELAAELLRRVYPDWTPDTDHSANTPKRFVQSLKELCDVESEVFNFTTFPNDSDEMVTMGPIPFYTLCAHHVVPFHGNVWLGYVPKDVLCGLSKLARAVKYCAKGMHVQEVLTSHIHNFVDMHLQSRGLAVVVKAEHMCMSMRGVKVAGAITTTAKLSGVFADHDRTAKIEFMEWIREN